MKVGNECATIKQGKHQGTIQYVMLMAEEPSKEFSLILLKDLRIFRQAGIAHMVEPSHVRLERDDILGSGRHSGLTSPADILRTPDALTPTVVLTM